MGRKSTIPPQIRDEIEKLLLGGYYSIDQLLEEVRKLGCDASRSAVGRVAQDINVVAAEMRKTREMARAWAAELKATDASEAQETIVQMLHTMLTKWGIANIRKDGDDVEPLQVQRLSRAVKDLMAAVRDRTSFEKQVRQEEQEKALSAVEKAGGGVDILEKIKAIYRGEA